MTERTKILKKTTRPPGVHFKKNWNTDQSVIEENHLAQQFSWLLNNTYFGYDGEFPTLQHKGKPKNTKKAYTDELKSIRQNVGFATEFMNITRRGALPK